MKEKVLVAVLFFVAAVAMSAQTPQDDAIAAIQKSHIDANVPDQADFDSFLRRDLAKYFKEKTGKDLDISYELLRAGPTQVGIGFPKYYVWVQGIAGGKLEQEGAVRLAAVKKTHFSITDYITKSEASATPENLVKVFPKPVVDKINQKLKPTVRHES